MKSIHSLVSLLVLGVSLLAGCASTPYEPIGPRGPDLQPASTAEVKASAQDLMTRLKFSEKDQLVLRNRLSDFLELGPIQELTQAKGITGVVAYSAGEGGFIYKAGSGEGLVSFSGGDEAVAFNVNGHLVGAVVGGGSIKGIGLVFGLVDQRLFAGEYDSSKVLAKLGAEGTSLADANYDGDSEHEIRSFSTGSGASADAGVGSFSVRFGE